MCSNAVLSQAPTLVQQIRNTICVAIHTAWRDCLKILNTFPILHTSIIPYCAYCEIVKQFLNIVSMLKSNNEL